MSNPSKCGRISSKLGTVALAALIGAVAVPSMSMAQESKIILEVPESAPDAQDADKASNAKSRAQIKMEEDKQERLLTWKIADNTTVRDAISTWATDNNWHVAWEAAGLNYAIQTGFKLRGDFVETIKQFFALYSSAKRPYRVSIHPAQKLVVIEEKR